MRHTLSKISEALGMTLLHSLWQGVLVFTLFVIVFCFFKKSSVRYWAGLLALVLQLFISLCTFLYFHREVVSVENAPYFFVISNNEDPYSFMSAFMKYTNTISMFWLLGVMVLFGRMSVGLFYIRSLRKDVLDTLDNNVKSLYTVLKNRIVGVKQVPLFESIKVTVPMTVGWIKPIVLLPIGFASGLELRQLEAILAHELAHVKRQDYLMNIIQSIIEVVFFYHPVVWIISGKIREERENCCDDIALEICENDKLVLAKALSSVANFELQPHYAMAFGAKNNSFKNRVKRVLGYYPQRSFTILNWTVTALILVIGSLGYVYASSEEESSLIESKTIDATRTNPLVKSIKANGSLPHFTPKASSVFKDVFEEVINHRKTEQKMELDLPVRNVSVMSKEILLEKKEIKDLIQEESFRDSTFSIANSNVYTSDWKLRSMIKSLNGSNKNSDIRISKGKLYVDNVEMPESDYQSFFKHLEKSYSKMMFFYDDNIVFRKENGKVRVYFLNRDFKIERFDAFIERRSLSLEVKEFSKRLKKAGILNTTKDFVLDFNQDSTVIDGKVLSEKKHKKVQKVLDKMSADQSFDSYPNGFKLEKKGISTKLSGCQE